MFLPLSALLLAIGFAAFTPASTPPPETVWYDIGSGWQPISNPCPAGTLKNCTIFIDEEHPSVQLYRNQNLSQPVKYN